MTIQQQYEQRTSWKITSNVWHALFMREAISQTTADRFAWFWMLAEPMLFMAGMVAIRQVMGRMGGSLGGADFIPWLLVGLNAFFLFRQVAQKPQTAIGANKGLFAYRQVLPVDTVIIRQALAGLLQCFIFILFILGGTLLEQNMIPDDPLFAIFILFSIWLLAVGVSFVASVAVALIPETKLFFQMLMLPLMIVSGVIFPVNALPHDIVQYLLYNPVLHGMELIRSAFFSGTHVLDGVSVLYLYSCSLPLIALGLALHIRFKDRLRAQ